MTELRRPLRLRARQVSRIVERHAGIACRRLSLHPQNGRNRLYVAELLEGGRVLAKRGNPGAPRCGECFAYAALGDSAFTLKPVALLPELRLCLLPYHDGADTLEHVALKDLATCLGHISKLAIEALALQDIVPPDGFAPPSGLIEMPRPRPDQLDDVSDAFRELLREAAAAGLLEGCTLPSGLRTVLAHGDIKLDNVLIVDASPVLIDFESVCRAPLGFDSAGFVALSLIAVIRVRRSADELEREKSDFRAAFRNALPILTALRAFAGAREWRAPDDREFSSMVAWHLLHRALSEAMHRRRATEGERLCLGLARAILANGLETMIHASA